MKTDLRWSSIDGTTWQATTERGDTAVILLDESVDPVSYTMCITIDGCTHWHHGFNTRQEAELSFKTMTGLSEAIVRQS